ncbi:MAG TPA: methyltransferase domain-containing protein [Gaiellaceae bacterium]|jgi:SAM-dependent methyltransferase
MTPHDRWLGALWPLLQERLPDPPASVIDLGCGSRGGFVPLLRAAGYEAIGVDPDAPNEPWYQRVEFERAQLEPVDAVVASTSLHHVADPAEVVGSIVRTLKSGSTVVVFEWASERFDEPTTRWCFERLGSEESWLRELCENPSAWLAHEHLHRGDELVRALDEQLERRLLEYRPYFFPDLTATEADEQAAIDGGEIQASRIDYVGTRPRSAHA